MSRERAATASGGSSFCSFIDLGLEGMRTVLGSTLLWHKLLIMASSLSFREWSSLLWMDLVVISTLSLNDLLIIIIIISRMQNLGLIGTVPMVTMAKHNTHSHMDRTHSLLVLVLHSLHQCSELQPRCAKRQLSYYTYRILNQICIFKVPEGGGANWSTRRKPPTACPLIGITY